MFSRQILIGKPRLIMFDCYKKTWIGTLCNASDKHFVLHFGEMEFHHERVKL